MAARALRCGAAPAQRQRCSAAQPARASAHGAERAAQPSRRTLALAPPLAALAAALLPAAPAGAARSAGVGDNGFEYMPSIADKDYGKPKIVYPDFTMTPSGLQYKDLREGSGTQARAGQRAVVDWDGYTIGYYGRPFEARNKAKGGAFTGDDKEYLRFVVGGDDVIGGFSEGVAGMRAGGIRRIVVGPGPLFYPLAKPRSKAPRPSTFSGERALYFVLENQGLIDKTLLFDIELIRVEDV